MRVHFCKEKVTKSFKILMTIITLLKRNASVHIACRTFKENKWDRHSDKTTKTEAPCHCKCGTIKIH